MTDEERIELQFRKNADSFVNNYFKYAGLHTKRHILKAYKLIVKDKILF